MVRKKVAAGGTELESSGENGRTALLPPHTRRWEGTNGSFEVVTKLQKSPNGRHRFNSLPDRGDVLKAPLIVRSKYPPNDRLRRCASTCEGDTPGRSELHDHHSHTDDCQDATFSCSIT